MALLIFLVICSLAADTRKVALVTSPSTPDEVISGLQELSMRENLVVFQLSILDFSPQSMAQFLTILDYSYSPALSIRLLATECLIICMYEGCPEAELRSTLSPFEYAYTFSAILKDLSFTNSFLVSSSEQINQQIVSHLLLDGSLAISRMAVLSANATEADVVNFIGKVIKPAGTNLCVFVVNSRIAASAIRALHRYYLYSTGFAYVFSQEAMWQVFEEIPDLIEGLIYVGDERTFLAKTRHNFEYRILEDQIQTIEEAMENGTDSPGSLRSYLMSKYAGKSRHCACALINVQKSTPTMNSSLVFPGNSPFRPELTQARIYVSGDFNGLNPDGSIYSEFFAMVRGFFVGYEEVNKRQDVLPNFTIVNNTVPLGVLFDKQWALQQTSLHRDSLGMANHPVALSQNVIGVAEVFRQLNVSVPMCTGAGSSRLSDPKQYPLFVRTTPSARYAVTVLARFFRLFHWTHTAIVYSPGEEDSDYYSCFVDIADEYGIHITNNETNRMVGINLPGEQLNATLTEIINSPVRIIILTHPFSFYIVERMYDLGARAGDYLLLMPYGLSKTMYMGEEESPRKRRVVIRGAMMFFTEFFTGSVGQSVLKRLYAIDGDKYYPFGCVYYDCSMLVAHALDFMIARGLHYEDGLNLAKTMRETRFQGCIGHIQIESGTNDKLPGDYVIINMQVDADFESVEMKSVATYSPFKVQLFNISKDIQWPNGQTSFPDTWERDPDCPYYIKEIRHFSPGRLVSLVVSFVYSAITTIVTAFIWRRWWNVKSEMLCEPKQISMEDVFAMASVPVDFFQMAAVGPSIGLSTVLTNILNSFSLTLDSFINLSNGVFWVIEITAFVAVSLYLCICLLKFLNVYERMAKFCICGSISYLADLLLPTLGNALFLPVISTFFSTFNCFRSTGEDFTDSFLNRDCYQKCWQGSHVTFVVLASVYLTLYTPVAVFTRPLWQDLQGNLHLKAVPLHLMLKSVVQMFLIASSATLRSSEEGSHGFVYLFTISCNLFFVLRIKAYNYDR